MDRVFSDCERRRLVGDAIRHGSLGFGCAPSHRVPPTSPPGQIVTTQGFMSVFPSKPLSSSGLTPRAWSCLRHLEALDHRIDMDIGGPHHPSRRIRGIESDGISYRALPSVRDRGPPHQRVLTDLGRELERAWTLDLLINPNWKVERIERRRGQMEISTYPRFTEQKSFVGV